MAKTIGEIIRFGLLMEGRIIGHQVRLVSTSFFAAVKRSGLQLVLLLAVLLLSLTPAISSTTCKAAASQAYSPHLWSRFLSEWRPSRKYEDHGRAR